MKSYYWCLFFPSLRLLSAWMSFDAPLTSSGAALSACSISWKRRINKTALSCFQTFKQTPRSLLSLLYTVGYYKENSTEILIPVCKHGWIPNPAARLHHSGKSNLSSYHVWEHLLPCNTGELTFVYLNRLKLASHWLLVWFGVVEQNLFEWQNGY